MSRKARFQERYRNGDIPWDIGRPDRNLIRFIRGNRLPKGRILEIGCGTGDNALWLARQGFEVVGIDSSDLAIHAAVQKGKTCVAPCEFHVVDFMQQRVPRRPFLFVFDRGCFHSFESRRDRKTFARRVSSVLEESGHWLSLIGSADDPREGGGPPKRSALDIVAAVEQYFTICSLTAGSIESQSRARAGAWICVLRKRSM